MVRTTSVPSAAKAGSASHDLLSTATQAAALSIQERGRPGSDVPCSAQQALLELAEVVRGTVGGDATSALRSAVWTPIARPLLDVLRRQILLAAAAAADAESFAESHGLLMAVERVQDALHSDALYCVTQHLTGTEALELLVEVAHDMRSPLGSILFLVDRVRSGQSGSLSEPAARQLGLAYSAAFGLSALASDLMELSRGSGRLMGPSPEEFVISDVFRRVSDMVRPVAEEKGLQLVVDVPTREMRRGYPAALQRVLLNLSTNACKFTSRGEVAIRARLAPGEQMRFEVCDTGRGVPPEVAARMYETFRPRTGSGASSGAYAFSSAGLGLAICRKLVAAMGGTLEMETTPNVGTCFHFCIPLPRG